MLLPERTSLQLRLVDALCIVQDSETTWQSEIKAMDQIYRSSLLTITAGVDSAELSVGNGQSWT
jgi:hypothetical protein